MITAIKRWFAPPVFEGDEKQIFRIRLINFMINLAVCFMSLIVAGNFLDSRTPPRNFIIDFVFIGIFLFLRRLLFAGQVKLVGYFITISAFILLTVTAVSEGTVLSPATTLFSVLVIISGFLFNLPGIIAATFTSSLIIGGLILAHQTGNLPPAYHTESTFQWVVFSCTFGAIGGLVYFYNRLTDQSLERSRIEIRERRRAEIELRKLSRAVEQSPASIVITDLDGKIEYVNPRFTQVTGYRSDEAIGQNPRILKSDQTSPETHVELWKTLLAGKEWQGEFINQKKDGSLYYEFAILSPITDMNGVPTHYLAVKEDVTERKQAENALRESEELFRHMFEDHDAVMLLIEPGTGQILDANHSAEKFYGYSRLTLKTMTMDQINVLSIDEINQEMQKAERGEVNYFIFPHRLSNGEIHSVETHSSPLILHGKSVLFSIIHDNTERKQAEQTTARRNRELATLYETSLQVNSISNLTDLLQVTIQRACDLLNIYSGALYLRMETEDLLELVVGYHIPPEWLGKKIHTDEGLAGQVFQSRQVVMLPDYRNWKGRLPSFNSQARRTMGIPLQIHNQVSGVVIFFDSQVGLFSTEDVRLVSLFIAQAAIAVENARLYENARHEIEIRRLTEIKLGQANDTLQAQLQEIQALQASLLEQALHDPLTGLYNRRYLSVTTEREIARAEREKSSLSIIISDIDHFKTINDTYGHQVGDRFLVEIANLIKKFARDSDVVCRYGGEEFLLVLPGTTLDSAVKRADEIRQKCAEWVVQHEGKDLHVTLSFGVTAYPDHGLEAEQIIIKADKALYKAKDAGRNRVSAWQNEKSLEGE